jgi:hypothetical protein
LASQFGASENRLGCLTTCFGHFLFFVVMTIFVLFINGSTVSRVFTLVLIPFNAFVEIKLMAGMSYMTMTMLILAVVIGKWQKISQKVPERYFQTTPLLLWVNLRARTRIQ